MEEPGGKHREDPISPDMPRWEKATWILIILYLIIVLLVFWQLGWSQLGFAP
jgi:hypothetical protein